MEANLVLFKPTGEVKTINIDKSPILVGRGKDCDIRVPIDMCSRQHCQLELTDEGLLVRDLGSANGTFVNNERINQVDLHAGDKITIGPIIFTVQIDGQPAEIAPPETPANSSDEAASSEDDLFIGDVESGDDGGDDFDSLELADDDDDDDPLAALEALADLDDDEDNA